MALHYSGKVLRHRQNPFTSFLQAEKLHRPALQQWLERKFSTADEVKCGPKAITRIVSDYRKCGVFNSELFGSNHPLKNSVRLLSHTPSHEKSTVRSKGHRCNGCSNGQNTCNSPSMASVEKNVYSHSAQNPMQANTKVNFLQPKASRRPMWLAQTMNAKAVSGFRELHFGAQQSYLNAGVGLGANTATFFSTSSRAQSGATIETAEGDKEKLLAEVSRETGNPDWVKMLKEFTLIPFGDFMEEFIELVGIPYMQKYTSDEKWTMESFMLLLLAMEVNRIKDPSGSTMPTTRQNTIASILMMIRLMTRIHQEMDDITQSDQGDVGNALLQTVLIGDMVAGTYLRAAANMNAPKVTEVLMAASSDLQTYFVPKLNPITIEAIANGQHTDSDPLSQDGLGVGINQAAAKACAAHYDHTRDDIPAPFVAGCEAMLIEAGLDGKLSECVKKFAYHISIARSLNRGLDVNPDGLPTSKDLKDPSDAKAHSDKALSVLGALSYPASRSVLMLKRLARSYVASV